MEIKNLRHALRVYPTIHHYLNIYDTPTFVVYMLINYVLGVFFRAFSSMYNRYEFTSSGHFFCQYTGLAHPSLLSDRNNRVTIDVVGHFPM